MKRKNHPVIKPLSKQRLKALIFLHGLQTSMFDKALYILEWNGLEYQFYFRERKLLVYSIIVRKDVSVCNESKARKNLYEVTHSSWENSAEIL